MVIIVVILAVGMLFSVCFCLPVGVALLLPAFQSAGKTAKSLQSRNNLKQIGLAMHNYHSVHGTFPPAYTEDENGNRLHSWRTMILPFLERADLHQMMDFNQAWDEGQNFDAANTAIASYESPLGDTGGLPLTNYVLITGDETVFPGSKAVSIADVRDGTSNTIIAVEIVQSDINWAEPRDLQIDEYQRVDEGADPFALNVIPPDAAVLFADGSVRKLNRNVDAATFHKFLTRAGNEQVVWTGE